MQPLAGIGNLFSGPDLLLILFIVLLLFGAKKLPELARGMGQAVREFNKAKDELEREITQSRPEVAVRPAAGTQEQIAPSAAQTTPQTEAGQKPV